MFWASLCPSSGEQDRVLLHMVFCTGCAGCGCVELGRNLCASSLAAPNLQPTANQERKDQCGNQHYSRELLMMGIVVLETC
jgi:hypothetical protein